MLGVDGIVLDRGIEPQPVALLAVVERALERAGADGAPARAAARAAWALRLGLLLRLRLRLGLAGLRFRLGRLARGLLGLARLLLGPVGRLRLELGGDRRVVLRPEVYLLWWCSRLVAVGLQTLLALEGLDLLDRHLELVCDPRVGPPLAHPPTDLVKLGTQGPAAHSSAGD